MQLTKRIVRVGNSAGIILPREWLGGQAQVELIEKPIDIKSDVIKILEPYLPEVMGIYLVGSYSRGEETSDSDIDILVITNKTNKRIKQDKYDLLLISLESLENTLRKSALPLLPMLKEAKPLFNEALIKQYQDISVTTANLKDNLIMIESALETNKSFIEIAMEDNLNCSDAVSYSLILNLRSLYIIECILKNKKWSNKELLKIITGISKSKEAYEGYTRVKMNKKLETNLKVKEAELLYNYLSQKLKEIKSWLARKR